MGRLCPIRPGCARAEEESVADDAPVDEVLPHAGARWQFDSSVTDVFDNMLARSVPQYTVMRQAVYALGSAFVAPGTAVVDLGCSRGEALAPFVETFGASNRFVGVEVSPTMLEAARERFAGPIAEGVVEIRDLDLRTRCPPEHASLTLAVLTIQFTPVEHRPHLVRSVFEHTLPGGAVILVEKIVASTAELDALFVRHYHAMKAQNGYTTEQIERKRLALEGVLVPATARWNEDLLGDAGFRRVECFWRWLNFAGWVAVRD
jgi:tRNA (cmo5U34)-methyltransferase